ncbi:type I-E CRISPR-associated protein Cse2/CasB [Streptomyces sp. 35G-GA-8]|uniref:type I-E CRISPR-associated protein Cse2/CasB n=1 Tax=Streptomyces sp. 35G-GA-8 TaxID=2939434 RepID=UPI00201F979C|nr:type I-E CRISPR-associated protein Cse2/CasB [Streptomyces sp. 35G-GA-8]MCL7382135.1 type I-E CRISPR-associated protein Cse2/CasB [Streptomyces sp. 35G-GA-8]
MTENTARPAPADSSAAKPAHFRAFTRWVTGVCSDPGARAALRTGVRRDLDHVRPMHRLVAPWLPTGRHLPESEERAYYLIAAMIADQPRHSFAAGPDDDGLDEDGELVMTNGQHPLPEDTPNAQALQQDRRQGTSLGAAFAQAVVKSPGREGEMRESSAETRLNLLTRQSVNGLFRHLPGSVRYLRQTDTDIDFAQLLNDLIAWPARSGRISRRWLQDYYQQLSRSQREQTDKQDAEELLGTAPSA